MADRIHLLAVLLLTGWLTPALATPPAEARDPNVLVLGSVAMDIPAAMHKRLSPLTNHLSKSLGKKVELRLANNMKGAVDDLVNGRVDMAYLTPVAYIDANRNGGAQAVLKTLTIGKKSFRLMLVTRQDSPVRTVADLAGRRFAFGDKAALLQRAVVVNAGMPLEKLGSHEFIGHYDNIARAVLSGDFDAGILKDTTAFQWQDRGLRVIHSSPELPPYNIAVRRDLPAAQRAAVVKAFLTLKTENPAHVAIIKALDPAYDGFTPAQDSDYDIVRLLIKPFQD
jgi:phosphonate transport system substrate-binding protein